MRAALLAVTVMLSALAIALTILIWSGAYEIVAVPKRLRQWLLGERDH